jgi:hypothetical protein
METAMPAIISRVLDPVNEYARAGHEKWFDLSYRFLDWERKAIIEGQTQLNNEQRDGHRRALLYLLKITEFLAGIDPSDTDLDTLRWRLQESWELIYNKPNPVLAAQLRKQMTDAFPQ